MALRSAKVTGVAPYASNDALRRSLSPTMTVAGVSHLPHPSLPGVISNDRQAMVAWKSDDWGGMAKLLVTAEGSLNELPGCGHARITVARWPQATWPAWLGEQRSSSGGSWASGSSSSNSGSNNGTSGNSGSGSNCSSNSGSGARAPQVLVGSKRARDSDIAVDTCGCLLTAAALPRPPVGVC
jgi:hypothetical protein